MKCNLCKGDFEKEVLIKHTDSKNYCNECLAERVARDELNEAIKRIFNLRRPTQMMLGQMATYRGRGFTTQGMVNTLYYVFDILNKNADKPTLGLIPYYYEKANKMFSVVEQPEILETTNEEIEVVKGTYQKPLKKIKTIDISEL